MYAMTVVKDTLYALDQMEAEPSSFEANVLETVTRQCQRGYLPSVKQHRVLEDMIMKYLDDASLLRALQAVRPAPPPGEAVGSGRALDQEEA